MLYMPPTRPSAEIYLPLLTTVPPPPPQEGLILNSLSLCPSLWAMSSSRALCPSCQRSQLSQALCNLNTFRRSDSGLTAQLATISKEQTRYSTILLLYSSSFFNKSFPDNSESHEPSFLEHIQHFLRLVQSLDHWFCVFLKERNHVSSVSDPSHLSILITTWWSGILLSRWD